VAETTPYRVTASIEIAADPSAAFRAWLDPAQAARFLAAGETQVAQAEIDAREGGAFRIVMEGEEGRYEHHGRYVLIDPPRRLVFTWISAGTDWRLSLVTIRFRPIAGGVRIDLEHEGLPDSERAGRHQRGWRTILEKLVRAGL